MALSATFTANFASFYDAVDKADTKLKDFGTGADKVSGRLDALTDKFSGRKIVQEAVLMAKAVDNIGGVANLTDKELERLGATAQEAVAKMTKLGMDIPKNLQEIADKTKGATQATTDWMGSLTKIAGAIGIAFSIDAIKGFIGSVFDAAGAVKDLSDQWGVSTQFVQQWSAAAKQSGVEAEQLGKSIQYVTEKLSESAPEYDALLKNIGLSSAALRNMSTEDAYREIVKKIAGITDETLQLDIAMGILGPSAKKVIGGIRDGMYDAADAQGYMSKETIKRLADAGDAWERFKNAVVIYTGEILSEFVKETNDLKTQWASVTKFVSDLWERGFNEHGIVAPIQAGAAALNAFGGVAAEAVPKVAAVSTATEEYGRKIKTTAEIAAEGKAKEEALKKAQEDRAKALEESKRREEEYIQSIRKHNDAILDLVNTFEGKDLIGKANDYLEALKDSIPVQEMTRTAQDKINAVMLAAIQVYDAAGQEAPQALYDMWWATKRLDEGTVKYGEDLDAASAAFQKLINYKLDPAKIGGTIEMGKPPAAGDLTKSISESVLRAIEGGGNLFAAAGTTIGNYLLDPKLSGVGKAITTAAGKLPGLLGSAISGAIPVVGSLIGPAVGWLSDKISGWFGKKEYEKLRDGFVQSAGGIAELTKAAQAAGISLDSLMRARKTDQVQAAIKTIQDALASEDLRKAFVATEGGLEALTTAAAMAGVSVDALFAAKTSDQVTKAIGDIQAALKFQEDAYQLAIDTATRYGFTIEELGPAMARQELDKQAQQLYKDWEVLNSAGLDTVLITEKMSQSVSEYVQHASKMGTEIPDAMRPMLEAMAKSGTLLDANGNAITDLEAAGLSFSLSMSEGFKALIDQVAKLTDAISRSLGLAIKNVPPVEVTGRVTWDVDPIPSVADAQPLESYQGGTEGFKNFGAGTPVMLHGWEAVVPREESSSGAFATVSGAPVGATAAAALAPPIIINAQGAFFDTPDSLQRLANKVSDALTAKYSLMGKARAAV